MKFVKAASKKSAIRGYAYYHNNRVLWWKKLDDDTYYGAVRGSSDAIYTVRIDISHPKKSVCNCPFADGRWVVCKHQVALYFTIFPEKAESYITQLEAQKKAREERERVYYEKIENYVNGLSLEQLREELFHIIANDSRLYNRLINDDDEEYYDEW